MLFGMYQDMLTTETLRKKFKNNFNLCNFAIDIGRTMIHGGEGNVQLKDILIAVDARASEQPKE